MGIKKIDFTSKFDELLKEHERAFWIKLNDLIEEFLDERHLSWVDFKKHGRVEKIEKFPEDKVNITYRDDVIMDCERVIEETDFNVSAEYKFTLYFKDSSNERDLDGVRNE